MKTVKQKMKKELKFTSVLWKSALYDMWHPYTRRQAGRSGRIADAPIPLFTYRFGGLHFPHNENDILVLSILRYMGRAS